MQIFLALSRFFSRKKYRNTFQENSHFWQYCITGSMISARLDFTIYVGTKTPEVDCWAFTFALKLASLDPVLGFEVFK